MPSAQRSSTAQRLTPATWRSAQCSCLSAHTYTWSLSLFVHSHTKHLFFVCLLMHKVFVLVCLLAHKVFVLVCLCSHKLSFLICLSTQIVSGGSSSSHALHSCRHSHIVQPRCIMQAVMQSIVCLMFCAGALLQVNMLTLWQAEPLTCSCSHPSTHSSTHLPNQPDSPARSLAHSLTHSFTHSLTHSAKTCFH